MKTTRTGTTLVELVVAIAMMTVVMGAVLPLFAHIRRSWDIWQNNSEVVQNGRVLTDHMHRTLAAATRITAVSDASESKGYIQFVDNNSTTFRYEIATGNYVEFGEVGSLFTLAGPVSQLQFTCYDDNDLSTAITDVNAIRYVKVQSTLVNAGAEGMNRVFTTSAYLRANGLPKSFNTVTQSTPHEFDGTNTWGKRQALAQIDSTHYLCSYEGDDHHGWAVVLTVDSEDWTVTEGTPLEFDTNYAHHRDLAQIDSTRYLCAYEGADNDGWATVLTVDTDNWTVTHGTAFEFDTTQGKTPALSRIDSSHFLCAYAGDGDDGWAVVLSTDLQVAHWKLDETSGTSAADATGNGQTGTLTHMSGSQWTTGTVDGALDFDGVDDHVEIANDATLQLTSGLTIAAWIKGDAWGASSSVNPILRKGTTTPVNYQLAIADQKVSLMLDDVDGGGGIRGDTSLNTGQWYHVAATWDGVDVRIYVDGVLDNDPPDARSGTLGTDTRSLYIGGRSGGDDYFDGCLDGVRLYAEALSATDILALTKPFSFREFTEAKAGTDTTSVTLAIPGGTTTGDLLISAVATDGDTDNSLAPPAGEGWTEINTNSAGTEVTLGTWWKLAGASESSTHQFTWSGSEQAYAWMVRFTGHNASSPINAYTSNYGTSSTPTSPSVLSSVNDAIILRLGSFDDTDITADAPGLSGHTAITMDSSTGTVTIESTTLSEETSATQNFVVSMPSTRPEGDLYLAQIAVEDGEVIDQVPSGWTEIQDLRMSGEVRLATYWKIGSAEPATYTWGSDTTCRWVGALYRISGINTGSPINDSDDSTGQSSVPISPSVTTHVNNCLILRLYAADGNQQAATYWPSGTTAIFQDDSAGAVVAGAAYETQVTSGTTGSAAFSMTGSEKWVAATIAVAPAAGAASVSGGAGYVRQSNSASSGTSTFALTATQEARMVTIAVAPGSQGPAPKVLKKTPYEFNTSKGKTPALIQLDSTHTLCVYTGPDDDGWATILTVDTGTWDLTQGPSYEFDNVRGKEPALAQIDSTHYLCAYTGDGDDGWAVVLTINTSSWTISKETAYEFDTVKGKTPALTQIDGTNYLCAYAGDGDDGWAVTLTVDTGDWTVSSGTAFEFDTLSGIRPALERIDSSHHLCVYEGSGNTAWSVALMPDSSTIRP